MQGYSQSLDKSFVCYAGRYSFREFIHKNRYKYIIKIYLYDI